jgi:hypothetical protein
VLCRRSRVRSSASSCAMQPARDRNTAACTMAIARASRTGGDCSPRTRLARSDRRAADAAGVHRHLVPAAQWRFRGRPAAARDSRGVTAPRVGFERQAELAARATCVAGRRGRSGSRAERERHQLQRCQRPDPSCQRHGAIMLPPLGPPPACCDSGHSMLGQVERHGHRVKAWRQTAVVTEPAGRPQPIARRTALGLPARAAACPCSCDSRTSA